MTEIDPGHLYEVDTYDRKPGSNPLNDFEGLYLIQYMKRMGEGYPGNKDVNSGTNLQELERVQIARLKYLNGQVPHPYNDEMIFNHRRNLYLLERRAAERHKISVARLEKKIQFSNIEDVLACASCGHIVCDCEVPHA